MAELWDDRAVQVIPNAGIPLADENAALKLSIGTLTSEIYDLSMGSIWRTVALGLEHIQTEAKKARKNAGLKPCAGV